MPTNFLGAGWRYPVGTDELGRIAGDADEEKIRQSIWIILGTAPGERAMLPDFGCGIHDMVFAVNNAETAGRVQDMVRRALLQWEPRIDVLNVQVTSAASGPAELLIAIDYRVRSNNSRFNLVYPFYLE